MKKLYLIIIYLLVATTPVWALNYDYQEIQANCFFARNINNTGQILGNDTSNGRPIILNPDGNKRYFNPLNCRATGINDNGEFVGEAGTWDSSGNLTPLYGFTPYGINNSGVITGNYFNGEKNRALKRNPDGSITYLPLPTISKARVIDTYAYGINDAGYIVGYTYVYYDYSGDTLPVMWKPDGTVVLLEKPKSIWAGYAYGINNDGLVVGHIIDGPRRAVLWDASGKRSYLNTIPEFGLNDTVAYGINDLGQIVGYRGPAYGPHIGFLLTPVPEPSSAIAFISGTIGLGLMFRNRKIRIRKPDHSRLK